MVLYSLKRLVNKNTRYYNIILEKSLFNEYIIEVNYGNVNYKSPTRILYKYFDCKKIALQYAKSLLNTKLKKGYC